MPGMPIGGPGGTSQQQGAIADANKDKNTGHLPGALSPNDVYKLAIGVGFPPATAKTMVAIAYDESGFKPGAVNNKNKNGSVDVGLWQINSVHYNSAVFKKNGWNATTLKDPAINAKAAKVVYDGAGFKAWATYNHGLSAIAQGYGKSSDVAGAAPNMSSGIDLPNLNPMDAIAKAVTNSFGAFTKTLETLGLNFGAVVVAVVLLVLGITILLRSQVGSVVSNATPIGKVAKVAKAVG